MATETNANLIVSLVAQASKFAPEVWAKGVIISEFENDPWSDLEGTGGDMPIVSKLDTAKGAGSTVNFRTKAGLYGPGVRGDTLINDTAEEWRVGGFNLTVDFVRWATNFNNRTMERIGGIDGEVKNGINTDLGAWLGRKKGNDIAMTYRSYGNATNTMYAGSATSIETIRSDDTISMDTVINGSLALRSQGAKPCRVGTDGQGNSIRQFMLVSPNIALSSLKSSAAYQQAQRDGNDRGAMNPIFRGGYTRIDGNVIREWEVQDHDGYGAVGCAFVRQAYLGAAITAGTGAIDITGGGSTAASALTTPQYFEFFSNFRYVFGGSNQTPGDDRVLLDANTTDRYVVIYNLTGTAAGKWGFYRWTTNDGNKLTTKSETGTAAGGFGGRLGATVSGYRSTTIGNVTFSTSVNIDVHPVGSLVIETNSYGIEPGFSLYTGGMSAVRGYGSTQAKRTAWERDGDFLHFRGIESIFGQSLYKRPDGIYPGFKLVVHAISRPGLALPQLNH